MPKDPCRRILTNDQSSKCRHSRRTPDCSSAVADAPTSAGSGPKGRNHGYSSAQQCCPDCAGSNRDSGPDGQGSRCRRPAGQSATGEGGRRSRQREIVCAGDSSDGCKSRESLVNRGILLHSNPAFPMLVWEALPWRLSWNAVSGRMCFATAPHHREKCSGRNCLKASIPRPP